MALKFLDGTGGGRTSDAVKSMNYAVAMGAQTPGLHPWDGWNGWNGWTGETGDRGGMTWGRCWGRFLTEKVGEIDIFNEFFFGRVICYMAYKMNS